MSTTPSMKSQVVNRPVACGNCRGKKIRCSGDDPCTNCFDRGWDCAYPAPRPTKSRRTMTKAIYERLVPMEMLMDGTSMEPSIINDTERNNPRIPCESTTTVFPQPVVESSETERISQALNSSQRAESSINANYFAQFSTGTPDNISDLGNPDWEYHGPTSFLSICSIPGIDWVIKRTGETSYVTSARTLAVSITKRLKLQRKICWKKACEPDPATAWEYCKAYFEHSFDALLGIVDRSTFESHLQSSLERRAVQYEDPAWYALRYTVYASGCRIALSKQVPPVPFAEAQERAWQFFENALSVHTELLYCTTGLMAVEALIAMTYFVECLGSPALGYMLCSCAVRLAQSKGLHRQAAPAWNLPDAEIQHRNLLFWVIYTAEKHLSYKSGRPSIINDDDISCKIPSGVPQGSSVNLDCLTYIIKHAQISSLISKKLATAKAFRQTPKKIVESVCELSRQIEEWQASLPKFMQPIQPIDPNTLPQNVHLYYMMYIRYAYFGSVMAIHSIFTYPWNNAVFGADQTTALRSQISLSSNIVAEAARNIIIATKYVDIDASSPIWIAFFTPLVALVNLFIYVLKFPTLPSTEADIALMGTAVDHFRRLGIASSDQTFRFASDATNLARAMTRKAKDGETPGDGTPPLLGSLMEQAGIEHSLDGVHDVEAGEMIDFYAEDWSIILPLFTQDSSAGWTDQFFGANLPNFI